VSRLQLATAEFNALQFENSRITRMTSSAKPQNAELQSALLSARENEKRWQEMQAEYSTDIDAMEQWVATAKLRRLEVERLETILAEAEGV
jgi:hypothetical protein